MCNHFARWLRISSSALVVSGLAAGVTHAKPRLPPKLERLRQKLRRPTPLDLAKAYGGRVPDKNPFRHADGSEATLEGAALLPKIIAHLEKAYPNATYASLGRDAVGMGDLLSAYYAFIGQPDRVARIDLSTGSFTTPADKDVSSKAIASFLTTHTPLRFKDPKTLPGFVVFDSTSYGATSQSRLVMDAIYEGFAARGFSTKDLPKKINVVSVSASSELGKGAAGADRKLGAYFRRELAWQAKKEGRSPQKALDVPGIDHTDEWHGTWGSITRRGEKYTTAPTEKGLLGTHESILWGFHETLKLVQSPAFLQQVETQAAKLGIKAPHLTSKDAAQIAADVVAWRTTREAQLEDMPGSLKSIAATLPSGRTGARRGSQALSRNAAKLATWLAERLQANADLAEAYPGEASPDANHVTRPFISAIAAAFDAGRIDARDFRLLLFRAFEASQISTPLTDALTRIAKQRPSFRRELIGAKGFFERAKDSSGNALFIYGELVSTVTGES